VLTQEEQELRVSLHEAQAATAEADELWQTAATRAEEIEDLTGCLADMSNAMSVPNTAVNNCQLRLVFKDVTKENKKLKGEVRDMQKSMEQLLLLAKFHMQYDELDRENWRLKQHIQELEFIAMTSQTSQNVNGQLSVDNLRMNSSSHSLGRDNKCSGISGR